MMEIVDQTRVAMESTHTTRRTTEFVELAVRLALWVIGSLLAIVVVEHNALLGLGLALAAGVIFGASLFWQREIR